MKKLVYFLIFLSLATSTSCLKKQNLDDDDLGPVIDAESMTKAMTEGFGSLDYTVIKPNEFSSYVLSQKIQDSYLETIEQQDLTINKITDTADSLTLDLILSKIKYSGGQTSQGAPREWQQVFSKSSNTDTSKQSSDTHTDDTRALLAQSTQGVQAMTDVDAPEFLFQLFQAYAFFGCRAEGSYPTTCYKLNFSDFKFPVPQTAFAQHGCSQDQDCTIDARRIEFDMLTPELDKDGKQIRVHHTFILSAQVPYLSRVLQYCKRSLYDVSNQPQKVLAEICYNINNYAFGDTSGN
jgi:hypothetical protein